LGLGDENIGSEYVPTLIEYLEDEFIISISAGRDHSLVLTSRGMVFGFGSNRAGQIGTGEVVMAYFSPILLDIDTIVAISSGVSHSLLLDRDGQIFSFGYMRDGRLGRKVDDDHPSNLPG
jgi:alpha-tubulin suppressor-like RCC1 family protein